MFLWEMATAVAGHIMEINPFDQPNVEASKVLARRMIDLYRKEKKLPQEKTDLTTAECDVYGFPTAATPAQALADFLAAAKADAYVCLQAYLSPTPEVDAALLKLQEAIRKKYKVAVVSGYGPRYLHSTGQLHKGDAGHGLFIQFTSNDVQDIAIPDSPGASGSALAFGVIKAAQAMGDRQALIKLGRKVIRFHLKENITANIKSLALHLTDGGNNHHICINSGFSYFEKENKNTICATHGNVLCSYAFLLCKAWSPLFSGGHWRRQFPARCRISQNL